MLVPTPPTGYHQIDRSPSSAAGADPPIDSDRLVLHRYSVQGVWARFAFALCRDETSARKEVREKEASDFSDLLFAISVMLSDIRKLREMSHPKNFRSLHVPPPQTALVAKISTSPVSYGNHEKEVWFAPSPARGVPSPPRAIQKFVPARIPPKLVALHHEEEELREWVVRLEVKLREPIERRCVDIWLLLTGPQRAEYEETDGREQLYEEEERLWRRLLATFKCRTPASHYTALGKAAKEAERARQAASPEVGEAMSRKSLEDEEFNERKTMFDWLFEMYGVRLYSTSRVEVSYRCDIEEEEDVVHNLNHQLTALCESEFRWSRLALTALHSAGPTSAPLLREFFGKMVSSLSSV